MYRNNIIYPQIMTAKPIGSKIIYNHTSYRQFLGSNSPIYNERMKKIIKKDFTDIKKSGIFEKRDSPTSNLYFFWASKYNSHLKEQLQDYIFQEIDHFYNNFEDTYAIVYVHSSFFDFLAFRRMLEKWPQHFFMRLRRVYIMGSSIMVRLAQTFTYGTFYRLCDQLFVNIDSEERLKQEDLSIIKSRSSNQIPTQTRTYKDSIKIIQNQLYGKKLDEYDLYFGRYPIIIMDLLRRLLKNPTDLRVEGIFRRSCDHDQLERLEKQIIANKLNAIREQEDIFVVAGCLKKILNNLSHPLFNFDIYNKVRDFPGGDEMALIKGILNDMEYANHKTFILLLVFLSDYVVSQQDYNKMSSYNLAVVFGPCFFRPKQYDLKDLIYSGKFAKVLVTLFDRQEELIEISELKLAKNTLLELIKQQPMMK